MFLYRSNRAEVLVGELARLVAKPIGGPLASECIVVQGKGMERWLAMELARAHGVWANPDFPFARTVIERAFAAVLGTEASEQWQAQSLRWAVAKTLLHMQHTPGFESIASYLHEDRHHQKLLQLSLRIARVLDGYGVYRPELLQGWQDAGGNDWQAGLWKRLYQEHDTRHASSLEERFVHKLAQGKGPIEGMPARLSLFGISGLPPLYLRLFAALASRIEVHLFVLSPSREYWADVRSQREVLRQDLKVDGERGIDTGNDLLASLGRLHRDFQLLLERDIDYVECSELYLEPERPESVLGAVQSDVLHLRHHAGGSERRSLLDSDRSLAVHSCHSPLRELEVLRDQLLWHLQADSSLEARDIIVMCPDIDGYAPFIDAVFADRAEAREHLPFQIADRTPRATYTLVDAFLRILDVVSGRLPGPTVLDLLSNELVRQRFDIQAAELATIQSWVANSHIRWGHDAQHRHAEGQPETALNTWRFGLDRLLLGYASPASELELFADTLAYDEMEGTVTDLLGRFADFCENLFAVRESLQEPCSLTHWQGRLERALRLLLVSNDETSAQHQMLRDSFAALSEQAAHYGFDEQLSLAGVSALVKEHLDDIASRSNFLSGGVTFCQLVPMRSIPHRVVCLIGMNDGAFPRATQALSFDLVASSPRLGDRSPRDDDRYLFLEAILAARDALIITYTGQSNQTNQSLPPSVLVGELLDHVDASFVGPGESLARKSLVVEHPLQAFSPRYFDGSDSKLFSYSALYCQEAESLVAGPAPGLEPSTAHFISARIVNPEDQQRLVRLDELLAFFANPAQWYVHQRVGIRLRAQEDALKTREPIELDNLERWAVGERLLHSLLSLGDIEEARAALSAGGYLPLGTPAHMYLDAVQPTVEAIANKARQFQEGGRLPSIEVDLHLGDTRLVGQLGSLYSRCRQEVSYSRLEGKRQLQAWIQHLVLCHQTPPDYPRETVCIGRSNDTAVAQRFRPVADAGPVLRDLLQVYLLGQQVPLPIFARSSHAFANHWLKALAKDPESSDEPSLAAARNQFEGTGSTKGPRPERDEPYVKLLFAGSDALAPNYRLVAEVDEAPDFKSIAMKVFAPLIDHRGPV